MLTRTITRLLCLVLAWVTVFPAYAAIPVKVSASDAASLQQRYPNARVIHVSPEQYPALRARLLREGYRPADLLPVSQTRITQNLLSSPQTSATGVPEDSASPASAADVDCTKYKSESEELQSSFNKTLKKSADMEPDLKKFPTAGPLGLVTMVVLIVVGYVLVAVWALYAVKELWKFFTYPEPCDGSWSEFRATSSSMAAGANQYGHFNGLRFMKGFDEGWADVGLSTELGWADIRLSEINWIRMQGLYWFIGPMLRWNLNPGGIPDYFQLQFLAGSTENPEMGIIAQTKAGIDFGIGRHFRWGLDVGLVNLLLHGNQGIITHLSQSYSIYSLNLGYRF